MTPDERVNAVAEQYSGADGDLWALLLKVQRFMEDKGALCRAVLTATARWDTPPAADDVSMGIDALRGIGDQQAGDDARWSHTNLLDALEPRPKNISSISLGLRSLDLMVQPDSSHFIVIGAHPKGGKSSLAFQAADATSELMGLRRGGVLVVSMEMSAFEVGRVRLAQKMGVSIKPDARDATLRSLRTLSASDTARAKAYIEAWQDTKDMRVIDMDETAGRADLDLLINLCRRHKERYPDCRLIVWDHTALADIPGASQDHERVAETTRRLKRLQTELGVAIIAPTQANRDAKDKEGDGPPRITLGHLLGGKAIERNPSHVLFLRDESGDLMAKAPKVSAVLGLCRDGPTGVAPLIFDKQHGQRFLDFQTEEACNRHDPIAIERSDRYGTAPQDSEDLFADQRP